MYISLSTWLALSAASLPTATAFYPYHYGDDSPPSNSRRTIPRTSNSNVGSITLPLRRVPTSLQSRQNAYSIINSHDPKQDNSVAIDQDGQDLSYMVAVTIGDSKEEYHLLLDSAASNTWVMAQDCTSEACKTHSTFGKGDSSSLKTQTTPFSVTYGTGSVSGALASDTLHIGPLSPALTFGLATNVSREFSSYPMDGILGIGRGVTSDNGIAAPQVMDVLTSSKLINSKLYGIHLSRGRDGLNDGELNLGKVNVDRFDGDLNWNSCLDNTNGFWEIPVSDAGVNGKSVGLSGRSAIIDTGTSFILMPAPDALKIHSQIPGFQQDGETFSVPCDTTAVVQFSFNKQVYNMSTSDWRGLKIENGLCRSNIIGRQTFKESQWLVGDVFLKNVYSVFAFEEKRVGFGTKSVGGSLSSSATSPSGTVRPSGASVTAASVGTSQTAAIVAGGADPTAGGGSVPPGQDTQGDAVGKASASFIGLFVALSIPMFM